MVEPITIKVNGYTLAEIEEKLGPMKSGGTITAASYDDDMWNYLDVKSDLEAAKAELKIWNDEFAITPGGIQSARHAANIFNFALAEAASLRAENSKLRNCTPVVGIGSDDE